MVTQNGLVGLQVRAALRTSKGWPALTPLKFCCNQSPSPALYKENSLTCQTCVLQWLIKFKNIVTKNYEVRCEDDYHMHDQS